MGKEEKRLGQKMEKVIRFGAETEETKWLKEDLMRIKDTKDFKLSDEAAVNDEEFCYCTAQIWKYWESQIESVFLPVLAQNNTPLFRWTS